MHVQCALQTCKVTKWKTMHLSNRLAEQQELPSGILTACTAKEKQKVGASWQPSSPTCQGWRAAGPGGRTPVPCVEPMPAEPLMR